MVIIEIWNNSINLYKSVILPILLTLIYFSIVFPIGGIIRLIGKDLLNQKFDDSAKTYWNIRTKKIASMKSQY